MNKRIILVSFCLLCSLTALAQPTNLPCDVATRIVGAYSLTTNNWITIVWPGNQYGTDRSVKRRVYTNAPAYWNTWSNLYQSTVSADQPGSFVDTNANVGIHYEYEVGMLVTNIVCDGVTNNPSWYYEYISTGFLVPVAPTNGNVCLLVESGVAAGLASRLTTLTNDLVLSGYKVYRHDIAADDVGSGTWSNAVVATKTIVTNDFALDQAGHWTLFIVGHVPVPYSGDSSPGGHSNNIGAHPADWYYTVTNANVWTDAAINDTSAAYAAQNNVPSDGKFDTNIVPGIPIMRLGRVDFRNMPAFSSTETQLLQQYLDRDHSWRTKGFTVRSLGLINSNNNAGLIYRGKPYEEHSVLASMFGTTNQTILGTWLGGDGGNTNGFLTAASFGNGDYAHDLQIGYTTNFASTNFYVPFSSMYGSYYGDWDSGIFTNAVLWGPLAAGGYGLNNYYRENIMNMGSPAMGRTMGQKIFEDAANFPVDFIKRYKQFSYIFGGSLFDTTQSLRNYISLLGDPTLKLYQVAQPQTVTMQAAGTNAMIYWSPPLGESNVVGYYVYRAPGTNRNSFTLLTPVPTNAPFMDTTGPDTNQTWWVRTVRLQTNVNRSFYDVSQGTLWNGAIHTNYYVMTNGSDSNIGTEAAPFLTIGKGFNVARPGDRIVVGQGNYASGTQTVRSGSDGLPIVLDGQSVAVVSNILVLHQYITLQNCTFSGANTYLTYLGKGSSSAHHCIISNNVYDDVFSTSVNGQPMIKWENPSGAELPYGGNIPSGCLVISNLFKRGAGITYISVFGDTNLIYGNTLIDADACDFFHAWGRTNSIIANVCSNGFVSGISANHPDFFQAFGVGNWVGSQNILIEGNYAVSLSTDFQLAMMEGQDDPDIGGGYYFRNNVFVGVSKTASMSIANVWWVNNLFFDCNTNQVGGPGGPPLTFTSAEWTNSVESPPGIYTNYLASVGWGGRAFNNIFMYSAMGQIDSGWYTFSSDLTNVLADYNFVCRTNYLPFATNLLHQSIGDVGGWNKYSWWENHGINGGNPNFANEAAGNFTVGTNSFLYAAGTNLSSLFTTDKAGNTRPSVGAWTIGPYEAGTSGGQSTSTASSTSIGAGSTISIGGGSKVYFQ